MTCLYFYLTISPPIGKRNQRHKGVIGGEKSPRKRHQSCLCTLITARQLVLPIPSSFSSSSNSLLHAPIPSPPIHMSYYLCIWDYLCLLYVCWKCATLIFYSIFLSSSVYIEWHYMGNLKRENQQTLQRKACLIV